MSDLDLNLADTQPAQAAPEGVATDATVQTEATPEPSEGGKQDDVPAEKADDGEPKKEIDPVEKLKADFDKRISRKTAAQVALQRKLDEIKAENEALRATQKPTPDKSGEPREEDFDTLEDYLIEKGKWQAKQEFAAQQAKQKQEAEQKEYAAKIEKMRHEFEAKEAEFRKEVPDYDDNVAVVNDYLGTVDPNSVHVAIFRDLIMDSDNPAALLYDLGKNADLDELAKLNPIKFAKALVKREIELANAPKRGQKTNPTPPTPVKGSSAQKPEDAMSGSELLKKFKLK